MGGEMNKTKIEWTDYTWNPITGCKNNCSYCYARKISMRFKGHFNPEFHEKRLLEPYKLKKPSKIFTCSMSEPLGNWIEKYWFNKILRVIYDNPQHTFQILTKCPQNIHHFFSCQKRLPDNLWLGVSIEGDEYRHRADWLTIKGGKKFISFEPLLEEIKILTKVDWIIIGGQTNPDFIPPKEWIDNIIKMARTHEIPVFLKDNLHYPKVIQEFPLDYSNVDGKSLLKLSV